MHRIIVCFLLTCILSSVIAQTPIIIGTGTGTNSATSYPAPYGNWYEGAKHQLIIKASELNAAGMTAGNITSLGFRVAETNGVALTNFSIAIRATTKQEWNVNSDNFLSSLTTVFSANSYTEVIGWNMHNFSTPFYWNGVSNLVVETCFNNSSYTNNAVTYNSTTSYSSVMYVRRDDNTVCSTIQNDVSFNSSSSRPDVRFLWQSPNVPPVTNFISSGTTTCSGQISFSDQSTGTPTSWLWNFGDGTTSTAQNPSHVYSTSGTYTVSLVATNQFGTTTETKTNFITVNLGGLVPVAASCTPTTQDGSLGFGITNVTFNTINESSGNASEGYLDNTCSQTTVFVGQTYPISIQHAQPTMHNCVVWIDYNNDGIFNNTTEKVLVKQSALSSSGNITIASTAVLNVPLRMRVIADYDLNAVPTPCSNPVYGQAEDYTVIVVQDMSPPATNFESNIQTTCDGVVSFTDFTSNLPTTWEWDFGDGANSIQQNPSHIYTTSGVYTVGLITTNQYGEDTLIKTNYIKVNLDNLLVAASCQPQTLSHCCGYGIYKVTFNSGGILKSSGGAEEGYQDFSCLHNDSVVGRASYPIAIRTGSDNPQDTRVWIDYNNNGVFENNEIVFEKLNTFNPSGTILIPDANIVWGTPLRMRVISDEIGATLSSCGNLTRGQVEDYAIEITEPAPIIGVGVEEVKEVSLAIYPNPTKGNLTLNVLGSSIERIIIYDLVGKRIKDQLYTSQLMQEQLSIEELTNGTYILVVELTNGLTEVKQIILNK